MDVTSDGIAKQDWDIVNELAFAIVNASGSQDEVMGQVSREKLFAFLDELENKYGRLPSILATRGDFAVDFSPVPLWEEAYFSARKAKDVKNELLIASSLTTHFSEAANYAEAIKWLEIGEAALTTFPDEFYADEFKELRENIETLRSNARRS